MKKPWKARNYKHGLSHTRIDNIYKSMVDRCKNPHNISFKNYGARGIKVCEEWLEDKTKFFEWAFQNGYESTLSIDRIDVTKGYSPQNCRWATLKEQANNKRNSHWITHNGETHTLTEWSEICGIKSATLWRRLKVGWSIEKALTTKIIEKGEKHEH